jgi:hypothetical protein
MTTSKNYIECRTLNRVDVLNFETRNIDDRIIEINDSVKMAEVMHAELLANITYRTSKRAFAKIRDDRNTLIDLIFDAKGSKLDLEIKLLAIQSKIKELP